MLILDTDVVSLLRWPDRVPGLAAWAAAVDPAAVHLTAITLGEIARGIARQERTNPDFAADLSVWLARLERDHADRILPFDAAAARIWGTLSARIGYGSPDLMIAAIALARGAAVVTRNLRDFAATGVEVVNPGA